MYVHKMLVNFFLSFALYYPCHVTFIIFLTSSTDPIDATNPPLNGLHCPPHPTRQLSDGEQEISQTPCFRGINVKDRIPNRLLLFPATHIAYAQHLCHRSYLIDV
jgi:hypothetical protein